jgi:hypothetical protein
MPSSFGGERPGGGGIITDGRIRGKHVSFLRDLGDIVERYDMDLIGAEPLTLSGNHVFRNINPCQFTATKM